MSIGRRLGGAPRWLVGYLATCLAVLLIAATLLYMTTVPVADAIARLPREAAIPRPVHAIPYADLINETAGRHHLNPALVAAVVASESGFNPRARSPRGAYGLMQVMPATWRELAGSNACAPEVARLTSPPCMDDPAANLNVGTAYLRRLLDRFKGKLPYALAAYNAGAGTVEHHDGVPPFPETAQYLDRVALAWSHLQRDGTLTPLWRQLIRSSNVARYARAALMIALAALALPLLWLAQRTPYIVAREARQGIHR
jgi:soluble lytic murein transglycosylase-like protein